MMMVMNVTCVLCAPPNEGSVALLDVRADHIRSVAAHTLRPEALSEARFVTHCTVVQMHFCVAFSDQEECDLMRRANPEWQAWCALCEWALERTS
jgi:hypothetical protein